MTYKNGVKDGIPIALGYLSVAFAFGVICIEKGFPVWFPILTSFTNFTGTGQFIGADLLSQLVGYTELLATMIIINLRYSLMSISLAQKIGFDTPLWQRVIIAFGVTDENFAVAISKIKKPTFSYLMGLMNCSFLGWFGGTVLGALLGDIFPPSLMSAFGIALYTMFIAIILPPAKTDKPILILILISVLFSCIFYFTPYLKKLSSGWVIIIGSIICSAIISLIFPRKEQTQAQNIDANLSSTQYLNDQSDYESNGDGEQGGQQ